MHLMYSLFTDSAFVEGCIWVKSKYGRGKKKTELNLQESHTTEYSISHKGVRFSDNNGQYADYLLA